MKNIWYIYGVSLITSIGLLIVCLVYTIRKEKQYILLDLILIPLAIMIIIWDIPYVKDLVKKETDEVVAVYIKYEGAELGAKKLIFDNEGYEIDLLAPIVTKDCVKMKIGHTYRIEYFSNCKVIKSYELIE